LLTFPDHELDDDHAGGRAMARIRTFIAVDVGEAIRAEGAALQQLGRAQGEGIKWTDAHSMHITLLFLGEVDELEVLSVCRVVGEVVKDVAPFRLEVKGVGAFPTLRRPKIIWGAVTEGAEALKRLHDLIEAPLLEMGTYRSEERAYRPHLTLGRIGHEDRAGNWSAALAKLSNWHAGDTQVREVLVMRSEPGRDGPVYTVLSRAKLGGGEEG
jgi:RNA 2',3'-cyclic 3'-phosphodiesterase